MAKLNTNYGKFGSNGKFTRSKYGYDDGVIAGYYDASSGCIYPDGGSGTTDSICPNFNKSNTFFFSFDVEKDTYVFQAQYRVRKRYSPSNATALLIDNSGSEVWTDWSEWTNEDDSTGEIPDKASDVVTYWRNEYYPRIARATWNKPFVHTYSELTDFDKYHYEFRIRLYNSAANECGNWTTCGLTMCFAPAITGYNITKLSTGAWQCVINTNWQRTVYYQVNEIVDPSTGLVYQTMMGTVAYVSGSSSSGEVTFTLPANFTNKQINNKLYFRHADLYVLEDGKKFERWLSLEIPSTTYDGVFYPKTRVEPSLPEPRSTYDSQNQKLVWYTESTNKSTTVYDDVHLSLTWTDHNNSKRTELYDMQYDSSAKKWYTTIENPPFDIDFEVIVVVVANGEWQGYRYNNSINVPSNGLICFNSEQVGSTRLKYNQSITLNDEIAGETIDVVGRDYPISRYGGSQSKTLKIDAQMLNSSLTGGDGWKGDLAKLTSQCDWVLRIPGGEKYRVFIESLDRSTSSPTNSKLLDVSISCKVIGDE